MYPRLHLFGRVIAAVAAVGQISLAGCGLFSSSRPAGITVGGPQDIGAARAQIAAGMVPSADLITFEGLFSEHDFAVPPSGCSDVVCLSPGVAVYKPLGSDTARVLIHVSMSSNIDAETFRHAPIQTVIVVDRSGSMSGTADSTGRSKMTAVKDALAQLLNALTPADEVAVISFNHEHSVDLGLAALSDEHRAAAMQRIARLSAGGRTDIESPLKHAFEILDEAPVRTGYERRVLLLTDALPNTGRTHEDDFLVLAERFAGEASG